MTKTLNEVLDQFTAVNQEVFTELEQLGLTLDSVEILLIPLERRMSVTIREHVNNALKNHRIDKSLMMKEPSFDNIQYQPNFRGLDTRNLNENIINKVLSNAKKIDEENTTEAATDT